MHVPLFVATLLIGLFAGPSCAAGSPPDPAFWFFWGSHFSQHTIYNLTNARDLLRDHRFNAARPTVIYLHGWIETPESESTSVVVDAYLQRGGYNILYFDWEDLAAPFYTTAMANVPPLGARLGQALVNLFDIGLPSESVHLVGHSLGSHVAGHTGRNVISISNGRYILPRITCLDPAGPLWYGINIFASPVTKRDAKFVDIIHTDAGRYGATDSIGSVDFWPNGGKGIQPGCPILALPTDLCSHRVSWRLWAATLTAADQVNSFLAVQSSSWLLFTLGSYNVDKTIPMGINTPNTATGDWYLQTNGADPRSRPAGYSR